MTTPPPNAPRRRHRLRIVLILTAVLVVIAVASFVVPIPHSFSYQLRPIPAGVPNAQFTPPVDSQVSGSWSGAGLDILASNGVLMVFSGNSSGSFSFSASNPPYAIAILTTNSSAVLRVTGTFWCPLLPYTSSSHG